MKINEILKKRNHNNGGSRSIKTIACYDLTTYKAIDDIANREDTNLSSIIQNLLDALIHNMDTNQTKLDDIEYEPRISDSISQWRSYFAKLNNLEKQELQSRIIAIDNLFEEYS